MIYKEEKTEIEELFTQSKMQKLEWIPALQVLKQLQNDNRIVLYAGTYSFEKALENPSCDHAQFYFYSVPDRLGYHFYINPMGVGIKRDEEIFMFRHRRLYRKKYLSNCFFGEEDLRSGEYFHQKRNKGVVLINR